MGRKRGGSQRVNLYIQDTMQNKTIPRGRSTVNSYHRRGLFAEPNPIVIDFSVKGEREGEGKREGKREDGIETAAMAMASFVISFKDRSILNFLKQHKMELTDRWIEDSDEAKAKEENSKAEILKLALKIVVLNLLNYLKRKHF
ncbi:hypothetical protein OUZ56_014815 [Daphnia magna]|uniref:Uncharacterized protein n=1 Tax=Daphnia magna TaxID=35525 RepID=A0ABR0ALB2_9CRUS|nr:hypothetical protein OUZ56_014815 [Daphnia magna]